MDGGGIDEEEKPIGELVGRLIDEGKAYARAEFDLAKATAEGKADAAKKPLLLAGAAFLFLQAAVVVLCVTLALALATMMGPLAGGLVATLVALGTSALLALLAKRSWESRP